MTGMEVTAEDLKSLLVDQLEVIDEAAFEKARAMANRLRVPIEYTLAERGHIPLGFLVQQLAQAWDVGFIDLKINDVNSRPIAPFGVRSSSTKATCATCSNALSRMNPPP
jgi:hypothetical protein